MIRRTFIAGTIAALLGVVGISLTMPGAAIADGDGAQHGCAGGPTGPSLERDQFGAYVYFGGQYDCGRPVAYRLQATLFEMFPSGSKVPITSKGSDGTAARPFVMGNSEVCTTSETSTYVVEVSGEIAGTRVFERGETRLDCGL